MDLILETERLLLREIKNQDVDDLFEMDSDPDVHKFIENKPVKSKEQVVGIIEMINKQYNDNGIARWAVVDILYNTMVKFTIVFPVLRHIGL